MAKKAEERLYFIVRSYIAGLIAGLVFPIAALILKSINFIQTIILGFFAFIISLAGSRICEKQINQITVIVLKYLNRHKKIKKFILKHF